MKVVGRKFLDNESLSKIGQIKVTVDMFEWELEKNLEFGDKMEQTDCWMGKWIK